MNVNYQCLAPTPNPRGTTPPPGGVNVNYQCLAPSRAPNPRPGATNPRHPSATSQPPRAFSAPSAAKVPLSTVSGFSEIESMPASTRKRRNSG